MQCRSYDFGRVLCVEEGTVRGNDVEEVGHQCCGFGLGANVETGDGEGGDDDGFYSGAFVVIEDSFEGAVGFIKELFCGVGDDCKGQCCT